LATSAIASPSRGWLHDFVGQSRAYREIDLELAWSQPPLRSCTPNHLQAQLLGEARREDFVRIEFPNWAL